MLAVHKNAKEPDPGEASASRQAGALEDRQRDAQHLAELRFQSVIEQSPLSTQVFTPDGQCRKVNRAWERLWGATAREAYEYNILQDQQLVDRGIMPLIRRAFQGESVALPLTPYAPEQGEYAGQERWCSAQMYPVKDALGQIQEVVLIHNDLTEHKRLEMELASALERWELAVNATQDGIWDWNPQTDELYWSPRCKQMLGYGEEVVPTREWVRDLLHPEDRESSWAHTKRHLAGETPFFELEYRLRCRDGSYRWILARGVALRNGDGTPGRMIGSHTDITDRKAEQDALRQAEERLRLGLRAGNTGTWDWDILGNRVVWSDLIYEFHGIAPGSFGGTVEDFAKLIHPDDRQRVDQALRRAMEDGKPYETAFRTIRPDGETRWLSTAGQVVHDDAGKPVRMLGATVDITQRRRTEQALRESEERFNVALKNTAVSVYTNDTDLRYTWVYNPRFGFAPEEVIGKRDGELLPMESISELVEMKRRVMARGAGERRRISTRIQERDFIFDVTVEPLKRDDGTVTGVTVASMDVTDLVNAMREAEQASRAKDQFLAVLSHELRTPLTPVLLTLSLIESRTDLPEDLRGDLATIRRNVELESRLISDLLDLTRISKGKLQLDNHDVDLHLVIRSAIDICQREASANLLIDLAATRHVVRGDSTRLQQVFWNLVSNSQKFTPPGGRITVRSRDAGDGRIRVEVQDTGVGIDPQVLPRLFDAFEQGQVRADRSQAGLGLGLAISRKLVEAHAGAIFAQSRGAGQGATFVVELPVLESFVPRPRPPRPMPPSAAAPPLAVLLVEDHEPTLRAMVRLLGQLGHRVTPVTSAASATAAARQGRFDLIISDLGLPDGSGLDVMRSVRRQYQGRAIALTGYGMETDVEASRDAGFTEHLTKPVDFETLEAAIRRVTSERAPSPI